MKVLVFYYSQFGNTKKIAEVVAQKMMGSTEVILKDFNEVSFSDLSRADLVVGGCPTHRMNLPGELNAWLKSMPRKVLRGKRVAAFDTSYQLSPFLAFFTARKKLVQRLKRLGGRIVIPTETFIVAGRQGPLAESELNKAEEWASAIQKRMRIT